MITGAQYREIVKDLMIAYARAALAAVSLIIFFFYLGYTRDDPFFYTASGVAFIIAFYVIKAWRLAYRQEKQWVRDIANNVVARKWFTGANSHEEGLDEPSKKDRPPRTQG